MKRLLRTLKIHYLGLRGSSLYLLPAPLFLAAPIALLTGQWLKGVLLLPAMACFVYGASLTNQYFRERRDNLLLEDRDQADHDYRRQAMALVAFGVFVLSVIVTRRFSLINIVITALATIGYYLNYLLDGTTEQSSEAEPFLTKADHEHLPPALREMMVNAIQYLALTKRASKKLAVGNNSDLALAVKLRHIVTYAAPWLERIAISPAEIRRARTMLVIYLRELANISNQYSELNTEEKKRLWQKFDTLLDTILGEFEQQQHSQRHNKPLEIQIQVLQEQLHHKSNER